MPNPATITLGRLVQAAARLRGGGTALPGLVVEKLEPDFAVRILGELPQGVVLVSGTNGKTTTVKVVTELLEAAGLRVFTNNTGSNFMRGVISSLLQKVSLTGRLNADIAVLELDEAHAVNFVAAIKPRYSLLLNVLPDQLDRFGSTDYTAELLAAVARNTTEVVVLNREDELLAQIPEKETLIAEVRWFSEENSARQSDTILKSFSGNTACFEIGGVCYEVPLALKGRYNALNATAALALVHAIVPETPVEVLTEALSQVHSAFGRGESINVNGTPLELILVKNPDGFMQALESFDSEDCVTMITVNDDYGDGRDVGWFFDVDFSSLRQSGVAVLSGSRAYDMALRLEYDAVPLQAVDTDVPTALKTFLTDSPEKPHRIFCSYTTMIALRKLLGTKAEMERVV
ncbi:MAG: MurT ligase domain-containing protein [Coriobacteriia bacterium]|nr:MurT ligase domain-containing protein [Coriobacteriia bacterium]